MIKTQHILIECADFVELRKKYFGKKSLYLLFRNVDPAKIFDLLREIGEVMNWQSTDKLGNSTSHACVGLQRQVPVHWNSISYPKTKPNPTPSSTLLLSLCQFSHMAS